MGDVELLLLAISFKVVVETPHDIWGRDIADLVSRKCHRGRVSRGDLKVCEKGDQDLALLRAIYVT